jgi:hypothetical protein
VGGGAQPTLYPGFLGSGITFLGRYGSEEGTEDITRLGMRSRVDLYRAWQRGLTGCRGRKKVIWRVNEL